MNFLFGRRKDVRWPEIADTKVPKHDLRKAEAICSAIVSLFVISRDALPSPVPFDPAALVQLKAQRDTIAQQCKLAPELASVLKRSSDLKQQLEGLYAAEEVDYVTLGQVLIDEEAVEQQRAQLALTEEEYNTLGDRHAALVNGMEAMCASLLAAQEFGELQTFYVLLLELRALRPVDASGTNDDDGTNDPVLVITYGYNDDGANDPVMPDEDYLRLVKAAL